MLMTFSNRQCLMVKSWTERKNLPIKKHQKLMNIIFLERQVTLFLNGVI